MQIYDVLRKDHAKVKFLLNKLINLEEESNDKDFLIQQIRDELIPHSRAEEAVFYNPMRIVDQANDIVMHGYQEHIEAEALLRTLQVAGKIDMAWKATAKKLKDALEHHIEEEEGKIFNVAKQLFTDEEAEQFAEAFQKMKPELKDESFMQTSFDLVKNLMPPRFMDALKLKIETVKGQTSARP